LKSGGHKVLLRIHHRTSYLYAAPVSLGPHRLMLRPRDSMANRLLSFTIETTPPSTVIWSEDVQGNTVAVAMPLWQTDMLVIDSHSRIDHRAEALPLIGISTTAARYPFRYTDADWNALGEMAQPLYHDPDGALLRWAEGFIAAPPTDTLALLRDINSGIAGWVFYQSRDAPGTQTPLETLQRGWGTCRDLAVLLADAVRWLGFGARLVSGYLYNPLREGLDDAGFGEGSTHCWVEIYLPGAGWTAFDPTHGTHGGHGLIPVAVARGIAALTPVQGSFTGPGSAYIGMTVGVTVTGGMTAVPETTGGRSRS
jgi:transglutaminase-like putative cysteine protease